VSAFSCYYQLVSVVEDFLVVRLYQQIDTFVVIYSAEKQNVVGCVFQFLYLASSIFYRLGY
jgi:hypothetical protein